jgi:hypothetical protein
MNDAYINYTDNLMKLIYIIWILQHIQIKKINKRTKYTILKEYNIHL